MPYQSGYRFLQIPGPTNVPDRILRAIEQYPIDHRGPEFSRLTLEILDGLRHVFQTNNPPILEQDYEDEFTQTQALNEEIARAAEELALRMDDDDTAAVTSKLEEIQDPAMTANLDPAVAAINDEDPTQVASLDDTGINPQVTASIESPGVEPTVEMPPAAFHNQGPNHRDLSRG